ncbi:hypothetical protein J6U76_07895 [bacterium]|nr:hypothetical protein [bacterium]
MNETLLTYSINKISSLKHYYEVEKENIKQTSEKEKKKHIIGAMIDNYLSLLAFSNEDLKKDEHFLWMEKEASKFIEKIEVFKEGKSKRVSFRFLSEDIAKAVGNISEESRLYDQFEEMPDILGSTMLIMLITRFEEFFTFFLSTLYVKYPEKYLNNQQLAFSEIQSGDIEEIKKNLVKREVEAKMRENFKEWFKIYSSHGLSKSSFENDLVTLEEIYARRNVLVHNSGIVNASYLNSVSNSCEKEGNKLAVDENYMNSAFNTVNRIVVLMMIEASKLNKNNKDKYLKRIFVSLFNMLRSEEFAVCEPAYGELYEKRDLNTEIKIMSKINKWICIIALRGKEEVEEEIKAFDVSALNSMFKMAKEILLENYETANKLLEGLIKTKEILSSAIEEWPLFRWYRQSEQYSVLKLKFPEDFKLESTEIEQQNRKNLDKQEYIDSNKN